MLKSVQANMSSGRQNKNSSYDFFLFSCRVVQNTIIALVASRWSSVRAHISLDGLQFREYSIPKNITAISGNSLLEKGMVVYKLSDHWKSKHNFVD